MEIDPHDHADAERGSSHLAAVLRTRRRALHLTQQDLADLAGVSPRFLHELENGKLTARLDKVVSVVDALGLSLNLERATVAEDNRTTPPP